MCEPRRAGGRFNDQALDWMTDVHLNSNYKPGEAAKHRRAAKKRTTSDGLAIETYRISEAELEDMFANATLSKRADDEDTGFRLIQTFNNIERPDHHLQIEGGLTAGSTYNVQKTVSESVSVGVKDISQTEFSISF
ncbi:hypothetical protein PG994_008459 [Apiospora phragmitis]|uniref:Uncharacterized protein n=1 Tax=Apiospora phragmitis TaxID=2905665 RepID=A0ABR1UIU6_9PEZI